MEFTMNALKRTFAAACAVTLLSACSAPATPDLVSTNSTQQSASQIAGVADTATLRSITSDSRSENNLSAPSNSDELRAGLTNKDLPANNVITEAGIYQLSGELKSGLTISAPEDAVIVLELNNASLSSEESAGLTVTQAKTVLLDLTGENSVTGASTMTTDDDVNAAIHSTADIAIDGTGTLKVTSEKADGINTSGGFTIFDGKLEIQAGDDGIRAKDFAQITGGTVAITSGGDGIKSDNEENEARGVVDISGGDISITSVADAIDAATDIILSGGTLELKTTGTDSSPHALKAGTVVVIDGAQVTAESAADGINSDGNIYMVDGNITVTALDDGLNAVRDLKILGGTVTVTDSVEAIEALTVTINGGDITLHSSDDGINASIDDSIASENPRPAISISDGNLTVFADADGIDSNGEFTITGGNTTVIGPQTHDNGAFDVDGAFSVTGGTLIGIGNGGMPRTPDDGQGWIQQSISVAKSGTVIVRDSEQAPIVNFTAETDATSLFVSAPTIETGKTYEIEADGETYSTTAGEATGMGMGPQGSGQPPMGQPMMEPPTGNIPPGVMNDQRQTAQSS